MQPGQGRLPMGWQDSVSPPPGLGGPHHGGFGSEVCQCMCFSELVFQYFDLPFLEIDFSLCVSQRGKDAFGISACFVIFAPPMGAIIASVI